MFLDTSSMVNLTCVISWTLSSPRTVTWYHNHTQLTFRGPRTGVSIIVDKSEVTTVSLLLQTASVEDSGLYECHTDNAPRASIFIHVIKGKRFKNDVLSFCKFCTIAGDKTAQLSSGKGLAREKEGVVLLLVILVMCLLNK